MRYSELTVDDVETWTELCDSFVPMAQRYRDPHSWWARLTVQETTAYNVLRWDQRGDRVALRTPSLVRKVPGDDFYWIVFPEQGIFAVHKSDALTHVPPRHAALVGLDQVCQVYLPASTALVLKVPRDEIDHRVPLDEPRRVVFDMGCGLGRVVQGIIRDVHAEQSALTDREFNAVCDRVSELLCMMAMGDMSPQRAHLAETTEVIRRYVRENVGVADLRLPAVARALGWSPRQLRLALEQAGTTYRAVRQDEAMRAARGMLEQQGPLAIAISEVAARSGFTVNWFSTAFKVRYGETPRDFRKRRWAESADSSSAVTLPD